MRLLALALVSALVLAGCAAKPDAAPVPANVSANATTFAEDYQLANASVPKEELQNATLGANHTHDLWGQAEQLVLLDATVTAGQCEGPFDAVAYVGQQAFQQEVATGCARLSFPEGTVVPEGTGDLVFEIDATSALRSGAMALQFRDKGREAETPPTTEAKHTWHVNLTANDWDLPHASATSWVMYVASRGPVGVLDGDLHARVVAHKLPGWKPILAVAHVDHWKLAHLHTFVAPGVMRLLDGETNVTNVDPNRLFGKGLPEEVPLRDIIAPGATQLVIVSDTTKSDCPAVIQCWLVPNLHVGGYERERFGKLLYEQGARRVYTWKVPDEVPEDSVYANASTARILPRIDACAKDGAGGPTCGFAAIASNTVSAHLLVFAADHALTAADVKALAPAAS